jgi:NADH:ubiquinone oxidoreductase subunit K
MLIVACVYPPVREGGIARFFFLLSTGQWGQFDWANIVLMFVTLFAVEAVVKVLIIVNHFRNYLKASKQQPANA